MKHLKVILLLATLAITNAATAGSQADPLGACFVDNTTGKDRKDLARWLFMAMGAHPSLGDMSHISDAQREETSRSMAALVTSLVVDRCSKEAQAAIQAEGSFALQKSFETLGRVAAQELNNSPEVAKAILGFEKYLDRSKFQDLYKKQ